MNFSYKALSELDKASGAQEEKCTPAGLVSQKLEYQLKRVNRKGLQVKHINAT